MATTDPPAARSRPLLRCAHNLRLCHRRAPQVTASHAQKKRLAGDKKMQNNVTKRGTIADPSAEVRARPRQA